MAEEKPSFEPEFDASYAKTISEIIGISSLSDEVASFLSNEVTFRLKEIVQQAKKFTLHGRRRKLMSTDIDRALRSKNIQPLFGFCCKDELPFRFAGTQGRDLFVYDDKEVDISQIVNANPVKTPLEVQLKCHWLAIDGVQPLVPENPQSVPGVEPLASGIIVAEEKGVAMRQTEQVQVKAASTHSLSVEQQVFFKEVSEACVGSDEKRRAEALYSLSTDAGLQPLLPRLAVSISEGVKCNIVQHNLAILIYLMRMTQGLVNNPTLSLDRVLHDFLPAILSCIISRQLCARPETDNHWALREFASRLLTSICKCSWGQVRTVGSLINPRIPSILNECRRVISDRKNSQSERLAAEKLTSLISRTNFVRV